MSQKTPDSGRTPQSGRLTEAEFLAAMRLIMKAERRKLREVEQRLRDAHRMLDAATADPERRRLEAERVVAEAQAEAERLLALSSAEAERMRAAPIQAGGSSDHGSLAREVESHAERRAVEEAETICQEARRLLETASVEADRRRADADRALAESRTEADQVLSQAGRVLAAAHADAERTRSEAARNGPAPDTFAEPADGVAPEVDPGEALAAALADPDPAVRIGASSGLPDRRAPEVTASSTASIPNLLSEMAAVGEVAPVNPAAGTTDVTPVDRVLVARRHGYLAIGALLAITNLMVTLRVDIPWISPTFAFVTILGIPTFLLYGANPAGLARGSERLAVSAVLSVGLLMVSGLVVNSVGPHLSIVAPLGRAASIVTVDLAVLGLAIWAWPRHPARYRISVRGLGGPGGGAVAGGVMAVALAVFGAIRLNNGAGAGVTLAALGLVLLTFAGLLLGRNRIEPGAVAATIYLLSAAILLMTSLRGWYVTGHDIQREFQVFQLTKSLGHWDMSRYQDGYNACLSVTILPTVIARWTRIADPYVFKIFFQLLFALCPVIVYHLARRFVTGGLALVATIYFVAFPTFLQDMPFLNRQEVALLFLAAGLLCLFNPDVDLARRKTWFCVLAVGMVLSHYSTTYVTVAVLVSAAGLRIGLRLARSVVTSVGPVLRRQIAARWAWIVIFAAGIGLSQLTNPTGAAVAVVGAMGLHWIVPKILRATRDHGIPARQGWLLAAPARSSALGLGTIGIVAAASVLWTGPLTHTSGGIFSTVSSAIGGLTGSSPASKSSDTSYSLFSTAKPSAARLLEEYRSEAEASSALRPTTYYDAGLVAQYPTPVLPPSVLPATTLGAQVERLGVDLAGFNRITRQGSARILQLFIALGLLVGVFARRRSVVASADLICLAAANLFVLALQVVLPALSVEYGVLRAFQQGLLVLDVFVVVGSVALVPRFFGRWQRPAAALIALCFLASSSGFVTQLLGGYGAQLHLNNSGQYFDIYYVHPEEIAAGEWLRQTIDDPAARIQSLVQTDRSTFVALQSLDIPATGNDILPPLVRREAYVFLGYTNVVERRSTVSTAGDLITYQYPIDFLDANKDLLYSTAGSRVYR